MFSQRKSFWKSRWVIFIIIAFIGVGYWFSQTENNSSEPDFTEVDEEPIPVKDHPVIEQREIQPEKKEKFYLLKENEGKVEVYYYEDRGEPVFIKGTEIEFSLLSIEDQSMLKDGILIETEEELNELLQDFGS